MTSPLGRSTALKWSVDLTEMDDDHTCVIDDHTCVIEFAIEMVH